VRRFASRLKLAPECCTENPRPERRLLDDKLIRTGEGARIRICEVLAVQVYPPRILRDADRGVDGRVGGNLEPPAGSIDGSARQNCRIRPRLRKGMAGVGEADLHERRVSGHGPLVASAPAHLNRRRIRARRADRAERIRDGRAVACTGRAAADRRDRLAVVRARRIVVDQPRRRYFGFREIRYAPSTAASYMSPLILIGIQLGLRQSNCDAA
jgi:hypothetical protein